MSLPLSEMLNPNAVAAAATTTTTTTTTEEPPSQSDLSAHSRPTAIQASSATEEEDEDSVLTQTQSAAHKPQNALFDPPPPATHVLDSSEPSAPHIAAQGLFAMDATNDASNGVSASEESEEVITRVVSNMSNNDIAAQDERSLKPPRGTTKNEGLHSDRRYLCYICIKLFTRRRSVRDHLSKIHGTKQWEPSRSLEIIVDPATGEPIEPLESQIGDLATRMSQLKHEPSYAQETPEQQASPPPPTSAAMLKREPSTTGSRMSSVEAFTTPAPIIGKKRPAPPASAAMTKKGTAKFKTSHTHTPIKKLKTSGSDSVSGTPAFRSPSGTPASSRAPKSIPKLKNQSTASVEGSSRAPSEDDSSADALDDEEDAYDSPQTRGNDDDDDGVYCICRKGDNHTWMIGCDGGCEEWFHGNCVHIRERDGDLIDKYICPNCQRDGFQTTWKRMCRRKSCRKPARVLNNPPSKYCSNECGRMFFVEMVQRGDPHAVVSRDGQYVLDRTEEKKLRKKKAVPRARLDGKVRAPESSPPPYAQQQSSNRVNGVVGLGDDYSREQTPLNGTATDDEGGNKSEYETDTSVDDDQLPNPGGALRAGEVKAIIDKCTTIDQWRELGKKPTNLPDSGGGGVNGHKPTAGKEEETLPPDATPDEAISYDAFESRSMAEIARARGEHEARMALLEQRETVLDLIKTRSAGITESVRKAAGGNAKLKKDLCGFDPRLAWTDAEFAAWASTSEGVAALAERRIGRPDGPDVPNSPRRQRKVNGRGKGMVNGGRPGDGEGDAMDVDGEDNENSNHDGDENDNTDNSDGDNDEEAEAVAMPTRGGVCVKNRCARHGKWPKLQLAELRFEQDVVRRALAALDRQERRMRERAVLRAWERSGEDASVVGAA